MERASGIDLTHSERWYSQSGTPELTVTDSYDEQKKFIAYKFHKLHHLQQIKRKSDLHIPLKVALYDERG